MNGNKVFLEKLADDDLQEQKINKTLPMKIREQRETLLEIE